MSGENKLAVSLVAEAVEQAESDRSMSSDSLSLAILSAAIRELSKTRSRKDLEMYIEYDLDNVVDSDMVITRGC